VVFPEILRDAIFWQRKANYDFGTSVELFQITGLANPDLRVDRWKPSPRIRYLEILSEQDCTYGSEEVININDAIDNAVRKNDLKLVQYLLPKLVDELNTMTNPTERDAWTDTVMQGMIQIASKQGNLSMLQFLMKIVQSNSPSDSLNIVIMDAVTNASKLNHEEMLTYLQSFQVIDTSQFLYQALYGAACGNHVDLIKQYRQELLSLNQTINLSWILAGASCGGHLDLVNAIIQETPQLNLVFAFMNALREGHLKIMTRLLEVGLHRHDLQFELLETGLVQATHHSPDIVALAISLLSEPLSRLKYQYMLFEAISTRRWPVIQYLLTVTLADLNSRPPTNEPKYVAIKEAWRYAASHDRLAIAEYLRRELPATLITPDDYVMIIRQSIRSGSRQGLQYGLNRLSVDCDRIYCVSIYDVDIAGINHRLAMTSYLRSIRWNK
jgi:hypothetical protein